MASKKKPDPARRKKAVPAHAKKPDPVRGKKADPTKGTKQKPAKQSLLQASADGREILRRAAIAVTAVLAVIGIVLTAVSLRYDLMQKKVRFFYAGMLQTENVIPIEIQDEQVQKSVRATKRHGKTHAFTYFCSRTLQLDPDNLTGYILFGNPADNDCDLILSIFDDKDNLIYRSGGLVPGKYLTMIRPTVDEWESGTYTCRAIVTAYTGQGIDYKYIGAQYSRLTVKVGETS